MASEISILNAEIFMGAAGLPMSFTARRPSSHSQEKESPKAPSPSKAKRCASTSAGSPAEKNDDDGAAKRKRTRGRPRLDPTGQNQTATDRRRTQIRLAQRSYRSRKENAIQSLEKKVQSLQDANQEINRAFMRLRDYVLTHRVLEVAPGLAHQLQTTTDTVLAQMRKVVDDRADDDHFTARATRGSITSQASTSQEQSDVSPPSPESSEMPDRSDPNPYGVGFGYKFPPADEDDDDDDDDDDMIPPFSTSNVGATMATTRTAPSIQDPCHYSDYNMLIFDNVSFPPT